MEADSERSKCGISRGSFRRHPRERKRRFLPVRLASWCVRVACCMLRFGLLVAVVRYAICDMLCASAICGVRCAVSVGVGPVRWLGGRMDGWMDHGRTRTDG